MPLPHIQSVSLSPKQTYSTSSATPTQQNSQMSSVTTAVKMDGTFE